MGLAHANGFNPRAGELFSREALAIRKAQLGDDYLEVADSHDSMAVVLGQLRRHPEALEHAEAALRIRQKQLPPGDSRLASSFQAMGSAQLLAGDNLQALQYYDQSIALHTQTSGADLFYTLNALEGKGIALRGLNRLDDAQTVLRQLYDTQVRVNGADAERVASTAMRLAEVYLTQGRLEPGHRFADISTRILGKAAVAERTIKFASSATVLAHFLELRGDYAASAEQHRQALAVRERVLKPDDVALAGPLTMVARVLQKAGHADEAAQLCHRALALRRANLKADHPDLTDTHIWLAAAYAWAGKPLLARAALSQATKPEATQPLRRISYLRVESTVLSAEGRHAQAAAAAKERSDLGTKPWGEKHPLVIIPKVEMVGGHMPPHSDQFLPHGAIATAWRQALQAR